MYRIIIITALVSMLTLPAFAADSAKNDEQKTLYAVGLVVARQLSVFNLTPAEFDIVKQGLGDAVTGKTPEVILGDYTDKIQLLARARRKALGDKFATVNKEFLEKAAAEKGAVQSPSGLVYLSLKEGTGATPTATATVAVNYRGTLPDGKEFDSSYKYGKPADFRLDGVIKCWTEGLQKMKVGGKARLVCPASLAYGDAGAGELILPGATLVFDLDLLEIKR